MCIFIGALPVYLLLKGHFYRLSTLKAHKFVIEYTFDFVLLGLVTGLREYSLAWHINSVFQIELKKMPELEYDFIKNCKMYVSNFIFETENSSVRLLKNRAVEFYHVQKPYLLPELNKFDYFIMLDGEFVKYESVYLRKLKNLPWVELAQRMQVESLPSKDNLLF